MNIRYKASNSIKAIKRKKAKTLNKMKGHLILHSHVKSLKHL